MQVKCNACKQAMNIPDDKLPKDQAFSITCPGCKNKIRVYQHLKTEESLVPPASPTPKSKKAFNATSRIVEHDDIADDELIVYEERDKLALVLDNKNQSAWTEALKSKDYKIQYAKSPEHAVHAMKFTHFHFIALNENYGDKGLNNNPVYKTMIEMPMVTRRNIFFALMGDNFKTLNNMQAFQKSVNVVINEKDIEKLGDVLKKTISDNETFYKVFKETLYAFGKG